MIGMLRGKVVHLDGRDLVLDVAGVGYRCSVSNGALAAATLESETQLVVYTDVRENAIALFGFASFAEREVFLLLKKVKGIGSKIALNILSSMSAVEILRCIGSGDISALQSVPGIGKKTAERVIVELREQVGELVRSEDRPLHLQVERIGSVVEADERGLTDAARDAVLALEKLGFDRASARKAVNTVIATDTSLDAGEVLRRALGSLSS